MTLLENMPHTCSLGPRTYTRDALGAARPTLTSRLTEQRCWVQNSSQRDILEFGKRNGEVSHVVLFPADVSARDGEVVVPDNGPFAGKELVVRWYTERTAGLGWMYKAFCEEEHNRP